MPEHTSGRPGAEHVGMIDVRRTSDHRVDQGHHLATWAGATDPAEQLHRRVDDGFQTESMSERRDEQQPGVRHQIRIIEGDIDPVNRARYSCH